MSLKQLKKYLIFPASKVKKMNKKESEKKPTIITRNKPQKISRLKKATRKLIEQKGYLQVTNHGIAKDAGVSIGLLYKYFPRGKSDILKSILADFNVDLQKVLPMITKSNWELELKHLLEAFVTSHKENIELTKAMEIAMLSDQTVFQDSRAIAQEVISVIPVFENLFELGIIPRKMTKKEIIANSTIIDLAIHHFVFYRNFPAKNEEEFSDYLLSLTKKLFEIHEL